MSQALRIGKRAFISALLILLLLMIAAGIIGRIIPSGSYQRTTGPDGMVKIIPGSYTPDGKDASLPLWRWFTSPVELLFGPDGAMVIAIIIFMVLIAGSISLLASSGLLSRLIEAAAARWMGRRNHFMAVTVLIFMLFGSFLGTMEESLVLVPLSVSLALGLGWDRFTGAAISLGAMALGFSAAVTNPFTIGVAQSLAGLPPFSGAWLRALVLLATYLIYMLFLLRYTRSLRSRGDVQGEVRGGIRRGAVEFPGPTESPGAENPGENSGVTSGVSFRERRSFIWLGLWLGGMIPVLLLAILAGAGALLFPLMVLFFIIASVGSSRFSGLSWSSCGSAFLKGMGGIAPGIILVLMAASIKTILQGSGVLDTILYRAAGAVESAGPVQGALSIYLLVLFLNFFISSGSAKAFLVMPLIAPLADISGIGRQTAVLAFMFGDGYSNILYPTNALLLICLAMTGLSWGQWFRRILPLQLALMAMSVGVIILAVILGY